MYPFNEIVSLVNDVGLPWEKLYAAIVVHVDPLVDTSTFGFDPL